jgi:hypothetical protein
MSVCIILLHLFTHTTHHPSLIYKSSNKKECMKSSCSFSAGFSSYVVDVLDVYSHDIIDYFLLRHTEMPCICPEIWGNLLLREMPAELLFRIMFRYMGIRGLNWSNTRDNCRAACQWADISKSDELTWSLYWRRQHGAAQYCTVHTHTHPRDCNCGDYNLLFLLFRSQTTVSQGIVVTLFCQEPRFMYVCPESPAKIGSPGKTYNILFLVFFSFYPRLGSPCHGRVPPYYN